MRNGAGSPLIRTRSIGRRPGSRGPEIDLEAAGGLGRGEGEERAAPPLGLPVRGGDQEIGDLVPGGVEEAEVGEPALERARASGLAAGRVGEGLGGGEQRHVRLQAVGPRAPGEDRALVAETRRRPPLVLRGGGDEGGRRQQAGEEEPPHSASRRGRTYFWISTAISARQMPRPANDITR